MKMVKAGIDLIKNFEGFRAKAYKCPAGVWTIGFGHTSAAGKPDVKPGMTISKAEGERILLSDLRQYEQGVRDALIVDLTPEQFSACVSLAYNIGVPAFKKSSVLRFCNARRWRDAADAFALWNKAGGRVLPGLVRRRAEEAALFAKGGSPKDEIRPIVDQPGGKPMQMSTTNIAAVTTAAAGITAATRETIENSKDIFSMSSITFLLVLIILAAAGYIVWERYKKARDWDI